MVLRKVLLMTPPYHCGVVESAGTWMPLGLAYLAGALRARGYEPVIYDAMSRFDGLPEIRATLRRERPDVVAITCITATAPASIEVLRAVGEELEGCVRILGGVHPSFMDEEILTAPGSPVDAIVRGEGEEALPELLDCLNAGVDPWEVAGVSVGRAGRLLRGPQRPRLADLERTAPAWDLLDWPRYTYFPFQGSRLAVVSSSRGCPHQCSFCSQQKYWERSWRGRCPEAVVAELEHLKRRHGVDVVLFADEYPTPDAGRWRRLMELIRERDLGMRFLMETRVGDIVREREHLEAYRRAGLIHVYVGVEATEQSRLDGFRKGSTVDQNREAISLINAHGMVSETSFVLGMPDETPASVARTLELARDYSPDFAHFLLIAPWPYAEIYPELRPYVETRDYSQYNLVSPVARSRAMSRPELMQAVVRCYRDYYVGRMAAWMAMPEGFKKDYIFNSMVQILKSSFLKEHLGGLGEVPAQVGQYLAKKRGACPVSRLKRWGERLSQALPAWRLRREAA